MCSPARVRPTRRAPTARAGIRAGVSRGMRVTSPPRWGAASRAPYPRPRPRPARAAAPVAGVPRAAAAAVVVAAGSAGAAPAPLRPAELRNQTVRGGERKARSPAPISPRHHPEKSASPGPVWVRSSARPGRARLRPRALTQRADGSFPDRRRECARRSPHIARSHFLPRGGSPGRSPQAPGERGRVTGSGGANKSRS